MSKKIILADTTVSGRQRVNNLNEVTGATWLEDSSHPGYHKQYSTTDDVVTNKTLIATDVVNTKEIYYYDDELGILVFSGIDRISATNKNRMTGFFDAGVNGIGIPDNTVNLTNNMQANVNVPIFGGSSPNSKTTVAMLAPFIYFTSGNKDEFRSYPFEGVFASFNGNVYQPSTIIKDLDGNKFIAITPFLFVPITEDLEIVNYIPDFELDI